MNFEMELQTLLTQIDNAQDDIELEYLRKTNEKKYWWTSILLCGLFYALHGKIGKMIISWILSLFTLGIFYIYTVYKSYKDQEEFNNAMEKAIYQRTRVLNDKN